MALTGGESQGRGGQDGWLLGRLRHILQLGGCPDPRHCLLLTLCGPCLLPSPGHSMHMDRTAPWPLTASPGPAGSPGSRREAEGSCGSVSTVSGGGSAGTVVPLIPPVLPATSPKAPSLAGSQAGSAHLSTFSPPTLAPTFRCSVLLGVFRGGKE